MKSYFLLSVGLLLGLPVFNAQDTPIEPTGVKLTANTVEVPSVVISRFNTSYPNINPVWSGQDDIYQAQYRENDTNMGCRVSYDNTGNLVSVEHELQNDAYPTSIGSYYVKKYPREHYTVWSHEDAAGNKKYCIKREQEIVWFDKSGKYQPEKGTFEKTGKSKRKVTLGRINSSLLLFVNTSAVLTH